MDYLYLARSIYLLLSNDFTNNADEEWKKWKIL